MNRYKRLGLANKKTIFWAFTKNPKKRTLMLVFNGIRASRKIRIGFSLENLKIDGKKIDNIA
jgi:hypothetical protein